MKKKILAAFAVAALLSSCNNQTPQMDAQPTADAESTGGLKVAFVEVDSVTSLYDFAKEKTLELEKKGNNARNTLNQKNNQLQAAAANFQQKLQNNGFSSREEAERVQAALQRQQNDIAALQARLENELASEQAKFIQAFQDSLSNFLAVYNKDKKFDIILNKGAILYGGEQFDITQDVINGLNKRYKKPTAASK